MNIEKLSIQKSKFEINLRFYYFLKKIVQTKLTDNQCQDIILECSRCSQYSDCLENLKNYAINFLKTKKQKDLLEILELIDNELLYELFVFSLDLYTIKDLLLQESKIKNRFNLKELKGLDPLSIEYDNITLLSPYSTRVNGALLALLFFERLDNGKTSFVSSDATQYLEELSNTAIKLKGEGVESNQIFMLLFNESINQSIKSDSGSNYEDRVLSVLTSIGLKREEIEKTHDKDDSSTEFDFFFEINGKTFGIGAKRTLRERYKQFIKTAQMSKIDVMIEITLGTDLTEEKALAICNHGVVLFVSSEIYWDREDLQNMEYVFPSGGINMDLLNDLSK